MVKKINLIYLVFFFILNLASCGIKGVPLPPLETPESTNPASKITENSATGIQPAIKIKNDLIRSKKKSK